MKKYLFLLLICFKLSASEWDCENCYDYGFKYGLTYSNVDFNQAKTSYFPGVSAGFVLVTYINSVFSFQTEFFINNTNYKIDKLTEKDNETYSYNMLEENEVYYSFDVNIPLSLNLRLSSNIRVFIGGFFEAYLLNRLYDSYSGFFPIDIGYLAGFSINTSKYLIDFRFVKGIVNSLFVDNGHYYNNNYQEYYKYKFMLLFGSMF